MLDLDQLCLSVFPLSVLRLLPAAFPPVPATSDPPPSAAAVSSAVPPLTGTAGLHTAASLLHCPMHAHTHKTEQKRQTQHNMHARRHNKTQTYT